MAKYDPTTGKLRLEGADVSTVALMAGLMTVSGSSFTTAKAAHMATELYRAVIKEIFATNEAPADDGLELLAEIWTALPESDTGAYLGEDLTQRLADFLLKAGRLDEDS